MAPPPPPPPPPLCFPSFGRKSSRPSGSRHVSESSLSKTVLSRNASRRAGGEDGSYSPTQTLTSDVEKLTFSSDTESYNVPSLNSPPVEIKRSDSKRGWGFGSLSRKDRDMPERDYYSDRDGSLQRSDSRSSSQREPLSRQTTNSSRRTNDSRPELPSRKSSKSSKRPTLTASDSTSTLVGSALERKINDGESVKERPDTYPRLEELRKQMEKEKLDYYVVPSEDAHGSEYVALSDRRREWISGFTGSAGQAIISRNNAYLITDSRYWLQAQEQLDSSWMLIPAGAVDGPKDWMDWVVDRAKESRIGIDARMLSHEKATHLNTMLARRSSKLVYPPQNLVDLCWKDKPSRSKEPVYEQDMEFTGESATQKLSAVRAWIQAQPPSVPSYSKAAPTAQQKHIGTLITALPSIAWLLNLRGNDVPYNPVFQAYLYVGLKEAILFIEPAKVDEDIDGYLREIGVKRKEYNDLWTFLRRREMGEGKVIIAPQTSYAISLMLTHFRYTVAPPYIEELKAIKNDVELEGLRRAYLRDGASFVRWMAWLEHKLNQGYDITEYEAGFRLTEYRRHNKNFMGLAYENISAAGPNAALPHYSPTKQTARMIDRETPYLNDSGGQYRDGTCDTTRTLHFGRPTVEQCEAFTRVLQGHIAIDSAIFPEGTSGSSLDVLARRALWKDGLNYMHGTGHGFGSFLNVHEGPHGFSSNVALQPGHVITNEPGFYNAGKWGMRIESALAVRRIKTKREFNGDIWLGFERLTVVPIQTRMVSEKMLTKEEKQWLKDHNKRCYERLAPLLQDDPRALKWLKREADRGIGLAGPLAGGMTIDWS